MRRVTSRRHYSDYYDQHGLEAIVIRSPSSADHGSGFDHDLAEGRTPPVSAVEIDLPLEYAGWRFLAGHTRGQGVWQRAGGAVTLHRCKR
ncbi:hypothetical protein D3C78_1294200 [compost metagenome]